MCLKMLTKTNVYIKTILFIFYISTINIKKISDLDRQAQLIQNDGNININLYVICIRNSDMSNA